MSGSAKPLGLVWEESPVSGGGGRLARPRGTKREQRARLGDEAEALPRAMALAEAHGGVVVGEIFPSARHGGGQWGIRWMGQEGSLCLGLVTLEHLTPFLRPPT